MRLLLDSFWRAVAYCLHPRVMLLSLAPLALMVILGVGLGHFYWTPAVAWMREALDAWPILTTFWGWIGVDAGNFKDALAPMGVIFLATPVVVVVSLLVVAGMMAPALTSLVAKRRFPALQEKRGASFFVSMFRSLGMTVLAIVALVISIPLWLVPPLVIVLPPVIWGWLTYQVMSFDALAEHASADERRQLLRAHRWPLMAIGVLCGYLGAAPSIVWASGVVFAAAFFVLIPLAIWIYTLVFAFSALWFAHYCLDALARQRDERAAAAVLAPPESTTTDPAVAATNQWEAP